MQRRSHGALDLPTGTLYPALRRLDRAGCVQSEWSTVGGRKRRTYRLTAEGKRMLSRERGDWRDFAAVIEEVLRPRPVAKAFRLASAARRQAPRGVA